MKFLVESEFQGQEPPRTQETTKTTGTIRIPRVGFGTDRPYIALFLGPTFYKLARYPAIGFPPSELIQTCSGQIAENVLTNSANNPEKIGTNPEMFRKRDHQYQNPLGGF